MSKKDPGGRRLDAACRLTAMLRAGRSRLSVAATAAIFALVGGFGLVALASPEALAKNHGDVWVDNVGQPAGPGHEMDPHLACADINLWGNGLTDSSGSYTIDGWPPSGKHEQDYSGTWQYDTSQGGDQIMDVIHVQTLIANARANGDSPRNKQGFHFKIEFSQGPHKHKTFWVNCAAGQPSPVTPTLTTDAVSGTVGGSIHDVAHLTGGTNPTGTITWNVYASGDSTCSSPLNAQPSTLTATVNGDGEYTSPNFAAGAGSYQWVATYSGDANNTTVKTACGDPNEVSTVSGTASPAIVLHKVERIGSSGSFTHGPITGIVGDTVAYQITVTNTGNTALVLAFTDNQCDSGTLSGPATISGTYDAGTKTLSAGGELLYTCSHVLTAGDQPYTNTASVTGTPPSGSPVSSQDSVQAYANTPGIEVVKLQRDGTSGPFTSNQITASVGDTIDYEIQVTNTGNAPLTLSLNDPHCDAGTVQGPVAISGTLTGNTLSPGGVAQYTCSHQYLQSDSTPFTNVATVTGTPPSGPPVTGTSTVTLTRSSVLAKHVCRSVRTGKVIHYTGHKKPAACVSKHKTHHHKTHHHKTHHPRQPKRVCRSVRTGRAIHYRGHRKPAACRFHPRAPRHPRGFTG